MAFMKYSVEMGPGDMIYQMAYILAQSFGSCD
jgi:hypothetical protein